MCMAAHIKQHWKTTATNTHLLYVGSKGCGCGCGHELSEWQLALCDHAISKQEVAQSVLCLRGWCCLSVRAYPDQQEHVTCCCNEAWLAGCGQRDHYCLSPPSPSG